jgi:hypothetical protein
MRFLRAGSSLTKHRVACCNPNMTDCRCTGSHHRTLRKSMLAWCIKLRPSRSWNREQYKYFRNLIEKQAYKYKYPRKSAYILNTFVEKINRTRRVQSSAHEQLLRKFSLHFSSSHFSSLLASCPSDVQIPWKRIHITVRWYLLQNGRRVSYVKLWQFRCHVVKTVLFWLCLVSQ